MRDGSILAFSLDSDMNTKEWLSALRTDVGLDPLTQHNSDIFNAYLLPSSNLNDFGECLLQVTDSHIRLLRFDNINEEIASWPLIALRRYGRDESKFTFECGRKCDTGEGIFVFNTMVGNDIYASVHSATQAIAATYRLWNSAQAQEEQRGDQTHAPPLEQRSVSSPTMLVSPLVRSPSDGSDISGRAPYPLPRPTPAEVGKVYSSVRSTTRQLPPVPDSVAEEYQGLAQDESGGPSYTSPGRPQAVGRSGTMLTSPEATGLSGTMPTRPGANGYPRPVPNSPGANGYQGGATLSPATSAYERSTMPLPALPGTLPATPAGAQPLEEIYEENGLPVEFRKFLAVRKDAPL